MKGLGNHQAENLFGLDGNLDDRRIATPKKGTT